MTTTTVTLTGDVSDAIGTDFDTRRTKAYVKHNTDKIVTDSGPIHLGGGTVNVESDGTFTLPNVVASTSLVTNLQATVYVDYADSATRQRATATFGPYDLSAETGTVDIRTLESVQALPATAISTATATLQGYVDQGKAYRDNQALIAGLTGEDTAVAALIDQAGPTPAESAVHAALSASYAPTKLGPRSLPRVPHQHRPVLSIDEWYPKPEAGVTHRLLWGGGDGAGGVTGRWYSWGHDSTLRASTNEGRTWQRFYNGPLQGQFGRDGLFMKVTSDDAILLTTYHPHDGSVPELKRSTDFGVTWATVQGPTANVKYLGPNSICKHPVSGNLYLAEYVTATPAAAPTCRIMKSTDQGATWTTWKTLSRAYDTDPEVGVMHPHSIQVDPFTNRLWVMVGDAAKSAGLYRMLADESDWEAICTNRMSGAMPASGPTNNKWCGAVSLMFFPNYIAWGVDQSFANAALLRLARTEFGSLTPNVEVVAPLNSTAFYCARTTTDHTEWVLSASQEGGPGGGRIDNAIHMYRIADDAATVDEIGSLPIHPDTSSFVWAFPIGGSQQDLRNGLMWWGTNSYDGPAQADSYMSGVQFAARIAWGAGHVGRPRNDKLHEAPNTITSPIFTAVGAGGYRDFGHTVVPGRATTLYIIETAVKSWNGAGITGQKAGTVPRLEVWRTSPFGVCKLDGGAVDASLASLSRRQSVQGTTEPYVHWITGLTAGEEIHFRLANLAAATATADLSGYITFAWGF